MTILEALEIAAKVLDEKAYTSGEEDEDYAGALDVVNNSIISFKTFRDLNNQSRKRTTRKTTRREFEKERNGY